MNVDSFIPCPIFKESFHLSRRKYVPEKSGCYVLTNFSGIVLYVGLAKNLQRRMNDHLKSSGKTTETVFGRAVLFHWIETDDINKIERTWLNIHIAYEGSMPILNKIYSPTAV
jgi:excinuclease UvrABC nuclease subunit